MTRLTIEITEQQHQAIKAMAALNGQSIKEYTLQRLFTKSSDAVDELQELKTFLHDRILSVGQGAFSDMDIDAIMEDELKKERHV